MTPQQRLEAAWQWYTAARASLRRLRRLAENYWQDLPWEGDVQMGRDNLIGKLEAREVLGDTEIAESRLDDLAMIELFSVFEGIVRTIVADQVRDASVALAHPVLKAAARSAVEAAEHRSFAEILNSYSKGGHAALAEQVRSGGIATGLLTGDGAVRNGRSTQGPCTNDSSSSWHYFSHPQHQPPPRRVPDRSRSLHVSHRTSC